MDIGAAIARANELNRHLDSWRSSIGCVRALDLQPGFGTLEWLFERYKQPDLSLGRKSPSAHDPTISGHSNGSATCRASPVVTSAQRP
jgi:hypothetical protein